MSEKEEQSEVKKTGFFVKFKKSLRIGGKKFGEKDAGSVSISGKSETSQKKLKYVNLIPPSKFKRHAKNQSTSEGNVLNEEVPKLVNISNEVATSGNNEASEDIRLDVGCSRVSKVSKEDTIQTIDDEEEQLRLYREMHEIRKQMILKEKQFQEEKLKFYKLQLEADNIIEQHNIK